MLQLSVRAGAALLSPTSGIIHPTVLVYKLHHRAAENGAQFLTSTRLTRVKPHPEGQEVNIQYSDGEKRCLNLLGIDSPGLTGSPAIARCVKKMLDLRPD